MEIRYSSLQKVLLLFLGFLTVLLIILDVYVVFLLNTTIKKLEKISYYEATSTQKFPVKPDNTSSNKPQTTSPAVPPKEKPPVSAAKTPAEIVWANTIKRQVVFTFDGGSGIQSFDQILYILNEHAITGTFFLTGQWMEKYPEHTKRIALENHEIFNHTYSHPHLPQMTDEEIITELEQTDTLLKNLTTFTSKPYFRPPYGDRNSHVYDIAYQNGYQGVYWTVDVWDWRESEGYTPEQCKDRVLNNLKPGTIYLFHIGDTITGEILEDSIKQIQFQNYSIVPLSEGIKE